MAYRYLPREDYKVWYCLPLNIFYYFISNQEQHNHNLHAILVKLHILNILFGATVEKIQPVEVTVANSVNSSQTAC